MAVNTETKRRSALGMLIMALAIAPVPDNTVAAVDREHIIGIYAGIAPGSPVVATTAINIVSNSANVTDVTLNHVTDSTNNTLFTGDIEVQGNVYGGGLANYTKRDSDGVITHFGTAGINGLKLNVVAKTSAYTATATDDIITCGAGNETFTIDLPVPLTDKIYFIKNVGTGVITVDANTTGSTTIDGDNTQTINQYECLMLVSDASVYWAI